MLDVAFENWNMQLRSEGIYTGNMSERLMNTRYADDVMLYAKSLDELERMVELLIIELNKVGLRTLLCFCI